MHCDAPQVQIIVVSSVEDFRRLARTQVAADESVLEIGCSTGRTTKVLARACARVVALDCSREMVERARRELSGRENVQIVRGDARDIAAVGELLPEPDAIFLDIGGNALLDNVASLLRQCLRAFRPRLIVVRSHELADVAGMITDARPPTRPRLRRARPHPREGALSALLDLSRSSVASDRLLAARKLRRLTSARARERLAEMCGDPSPSVRRAAGAAGPRDGAESS